LSPALFVVDNVFDFRKFLFDQNWAGVLSTYEFVLSACVVYIIIIYVVQILMKSRKYPVHLKGFAVIHNTFLSSASLLLLILYAENVVPKLQRLGLYGAICAHEVFYDSPFIFFGFLNYLLKFYELVDTVLMTLKKKELTRLHVFHHTMTLLLTFVQLKEHTSVQWVPITANLVVHVIMYYYYTLSTLGIRSWWKPYLTVLQIVQFVVDVIFCYYASYVHFFLPHWGCNGTSLAAIFGSGLLSIYLALFVDFFVRTYFASSESKNGEKVSERSVRASNGKRKSKKE